MKIISDFKDYYDHGAAYGIDENLVYNRFSKIIHPPKRIKDRGHKIIGFCDEFWEVTKIHYEYYGRNMYRRSKNTKFEDDVKKHVEKGWIEGTIVYEKYPVSNPKIDFQYMLRKVDLTNKIWSQYAWFNKNWTHWNNWLKSVFTEYQVPIFYFTDNRSQDVILNPNLTDLGLQKVMDSVEAFQKLSTYIPSLRPKDDFQMTNEQLGKSKGFDNYSFRNKNTKKKPKKF